MTLRTPPEIDLFPECGNGAINLFLAHVDHMHDALAAIDASQRSTIVRANSTALQHPLDVARVIVDRGEVSGALPIC